MKNESQLNTQLREIIENFNLAFVYLVIIDCDSGFFFGFFFDNWQIFTIDESLIII